MRRIDLAKDEENKYEVIKELVDRMATKTGQLKSIFFIPRIKCLSNP